MNYYEHHLGDYLRDAGHLSFIEDAAYRRLIDVYYVRERPLPADVKECQKLARCTSAAERKSVVYVLESFFERRDDGFHQKRCDEVIAEFHAKQRKARDSANARWNAKLSGSERNANAMRTQCERNANAMRQGVKTGCENDAPSPQSPVPSPQTPDTGSLFPDVFSHPDTGFGCSRLLATPASEPDCIDDQQATGATRQSAVVDRGSPTPGSRGGGGKVSPPKRRRMPADYDAEPMRTWARENTPGVDFDREIAKLRDHQFRDAHSDWGAVIRNWMRKAEDIAAGRPARVNGSSETGQPLTKFERIRAIQQRALDEATDG